VEKNYFGLRLVIFFTTGFLLAPAAGLLEPSFLAESGFLLVSGFLAGGVALADLASLAGLVF
jgi:hypothetical protein